MIDKLISLICNIFDHKLDANNWQYESYTGQTYYFCNRCKYYVPLYYVD